MMLDHKKYDKQLSIKLKKKVHHHLCRRSTSQLDSVLPSIICWVVLTMWFAVLPPPSLPSLYLLPGSSSRLIAPSWLCGCTSLVVGLSFSSWLREILLLLVKWCHHHCPLFEFFPSHIQQSNALMRRSFLPH